MDLQLNNFAPSSKEHFQCYRTDTQCKYFIELISKDIQDKLINQDLDNSDFISVLADGSTDKANEEQEMIYICMLKDFKPVTKFVNIVSIPHANAENITSNIIKTFEETLRFEDWRNNVVSACFDGASVMLGHLTGVATRLKNEASHILAIRH